MGDLAALKFALGLLWAAPRMMMAVRADSATAYVELSVAALLAIIPALVIATMAVIFQVWIMLVVQIAFMAGAALVALGFWRNDGRLLDSGNARFGLVLVLVAGAAGMAVIRLTDLGPRIDEQINAALPNLVILLGMAMLASSNYFGRFRRRMQVASLVVLAPGAAASVVVAFINAAALSGGQRLLPLVSVVPAGVLAWACYSVAARTRVFADEPAEPELL